MALEWIVPMALFGVFVSSSSASWIRRQRRLDDGRARGARRGWVVPVQIRSTFPMDLRGDAIVDTTLDERTAMWALIERAHELGYDRTEGTNVSLAFHRGSEWRALSSFDLCDVPSEVAVFVQPSPAPGVVRLRCVMTFRSAAHYVDEIDVEQASNEFSALIEVLRPIRAMPAHS